MNIILASSWIIKINGNSDFLFNDEVLLVKGIFENGRLVIIERYQWEGNRSSRGKHVTGIIPILKRKIQQYSMAISEN